MKYVLLAAMLMTSALTRTTSAAASPPTGFVNAVPSKQSVKLFSKHTITFVVEEFAVNSEDFQQQTTQFVAVPVVFTLCASTITVQPNVVVPLEETRMFLFLCNNNDPTTNHRVMFNPNPYSMARSCGGQTSFTYNPSNNNHKNSGASRYGDLLFELHQVV